ncbi:RpiB/LacA/LacB family sugar-phosphate isomerase [Candidatus Peregrinibacteria bacterium]|nr:RpiB/LacA/LacB family sugar-phosphate isomerase [Candidatus Peregrinibacteria bacterium]
MLIYIGADHQGFQLKDALKKFLKERGYEVIDVGNDKYDENDDYPDFAVLVTRQVAQDTTITRGILI